MFGKRGEGGWSENLEGLWHDTDRVQLADLSFDSKAANLAHGIYPSTTAHVDATYPFPTLWHAHHGTCRLVDLLPSKPDFHSLLRAFEHHAPLYYFPYVPEECTERGVDQFLTNPERNSLLHPDILALLFAALAQGVQSGLHDRCGGKWVPGAMDREMKKGDVFSEATLTSLGGFILTASHSRRRNALATDSYLPEQANITCCRNVAHDWPISD